MLEFWIQANAFYSMHESIILALASILLVGVQNLGFWEIRKELEAVEDNMFEDLAEVLAQRFLDPMNPFNRLKRPALRSCIDCGDQYASVVSVIADERLCPDCFADHHYAELEQIRRKQMLLRYYSQEEILVAAILGQELPIPRLWWK